ncbi:hypothetical protein [Xanthomonas euvesicatoria]|uniref:M61 family metallopeptidase n=1 Tax=Xanthomonas euvesicatoria TaxID=456327 RepID=UPI001C4844F6|nr:hypothetical protein [Xanthomonas campestris pv. coriandri]MCE4327692.1 hypothetical protein [Xanthomonas campestris pv. coriandri]
MTTISTAGPPTDGKKSGPVSLDLLLSPVITKDGGHSIRVTYKLLGNNNDSPLVLQWDLLAPTPGRSTDEVENLKVNDSTGPLTMKSSPDNYNLNILYKSDRRPIGPVSVSYTVSPADPSAPNGRGAHREFIVASGGFTTTGDGILMLPKLESDVNLRLHWKLPHGFEAASSFGYGDITTQRQSWEILNSFYLSGKLNKFHFSAGKIDFNVYGLGNNDVNLSNLFSWSAREYEVTRHLFPDPTEKSFRAFYRSFDGGPLDSGRADSNGLLLYIAPTHSEQLAMSNLKQIAAHEMIHVVQPRFDDEANSLWFLEGSANYLSMAIPFESGLISREDYLQQINAEANRYYGNSRRNIPNSSIPDEMWKSPDSSTVAYNRGAIYFADLDARVRSKSHGKATVITLMKELQEMSNQNKPHGLVQWREIVERHAGKEGAEALDAMLAGRTIFPVAGTFGQCLEAKKTEIGIFDLQYSKAPGENQIVSVTPGSNAERAGLKVGDALAGNTLMKPYFSEVGRALPLPIKRNGQRMTISYVPRSGSTEARTWQASSDKLCSDKME